MSKRKKKKVINIPIKKDSNKNKDKESVVDAVSGSKREEMLESSVLIDNDNKVEKSVASVEDGNESKQEHYEFSEIIVDDAGEKEEPVIMEKQKEEVVTIKLPSMSTSKIISNLTYVAVFLLVFIFVDYMFQYINNDYSAAIVNNTRISYKAVEDEVKNGMNKNTYIQEILSPTLQMMINNEMERLEAVEKNITVTDEEVAKYVYDSILVNFIEQYKTENPSSASMSAEDIEREARAKYGEAVAQVYGLEIEEFEKNYIKPQVLSRKLRLGEYKPSEDEINAKLDEYAKDNEGFVRDDAAKNAAVSELEENYLNTTAQDYSTYLLDKYNVQNNFLRKYGDEEPYKYRLFGYFTDIVKGLIGKEETTTETTN